MTADDPIRAEVERRLHALVGATIAAPVAVVTRARRCVSRRAGAVRDRLVEPARVATALFQLASGSSGEPPATRTAATARQADPPVAAPANGAAATPGELPLEEYESLAASQVVARLPSLTPSELTAVRRFEADHRGRRTVLGRIDQLLPVSPSLAGRG